MALPDTNSLVGAFSLGIQSAKGTQATKLHTALATRSNLGTAFDLRQPLQEHPSSTGARSFAQATPAKRTGYLGRAGARFVLRPKFIGQALIAAGFDWTTAAGPESGTYKHTFVVEDDDALRWMSVIHNVGAGSSSYDRLLRDARANRLNFDFSNERIECDLALASLYVGKVSGTPTYTSEVDEEIDPSVSGTLEINFDADSSVLTDEIRGWTCEIANALKEQATDRPLQASGRTDLARDRIDAKGVIRGVNIDEDLWWKVVGNDAAATVPSLIKATGDMTMLFNSSGNIGATATPYSLKWILPKVDYEFPEDGIVNQNADSVRVDINWTMNTNGVSQPITLELINDQATYTA